ncbi:MAG: serine/threonine-protein kinase, partial [Gemmatimonadota bacterium]|nr:serine/threonine-protein kinase [Gemmatimonadota bacterium]
SRVGPYRLVRLLGEGGMGRVYLAERAGEDFEQRVAIKMVRPGWHARELYARFLRERRILASLTHPNIARLLDGGLTAEGRPWFAMEYVDGRPIDDYCERAGLGLGDRIRLFITVCEGVQFAHQNLVVHRDLKPGNVFVTPNGIPKLLDFGMARLMSGVGSQESTLTRPGLLRMTPEYASPEQIRGGPATTATDTYALGVILYELLTGSRPYAVSGSPVEIERTIRTTEPPPPSERVLDGPASAGLGYSPKRLRRRLAGDLDRIVLKALRKEPARRYPTAGGLADDLRRHLAGLPVSARPDTLRYRVGRFVRRHRTGVAAAAVVALSLVAGIIGTATQATRAAEQAAQARRAAERAERVSDFLADLFTAADPAEARGRDPTATELLDRGARRLREDEALAEDPAIRADLLTVLADVHANLGRDDRAEALAREALELRRETLPPDHPDIAEALETLGVILVNERELNEAGSLLSEGLEILRARAEEPDDVLASAYTNLAAVALFRGELDSAASLLREGIAIRRRIGDSADLANSLDGLAIVHARRGDHEEAIALHREALDLRSRLLEPDHPALAGTRQNLAVALIRAGRPAAAEPHLRRAVDTWREVLGPDHPRLGIAVANLGTSLMRQGRLSAAESMFVASVEIRRRLYPEGDHPSLGSAVNSLGTLYLRTGDLDRAERLYLEAREIRRRAFGEDHPTYLASLSNLGALYRERGELGRAESFYRQALEGRIRVQGEVHHDTDVDRLELALVLSARGSAEEARRLGLPALERLAEISEDDSLVARGRRALLEPVP